MRKRRGSIRTNIRSIKFEYKGKFYIVHPNGKDKKGNMRVSIYRKKVASLAELDGPGTLYRLKGSELIEVGRAFQDQLDEEAERDALNKALRPERGDWTPGTAEEPSVGEHEQ